MAFRFPFGGTGTVLGQIEQSPSPESAFPLVLVDLPGMD